MNKKIVIAVITIVIIVGIIVIFSNNNSKNTNEGNSTLPYIPDGANVVNGNEIGKSADNIKFDRKIENVNIEVLKDTITKKSVEIQITDNNRDHFAWGVAFGVQKKINEEWKDIKYVSDNLSWIDIAYELGENNKLTQKLDIEEYYGELSEGTYRIVKPIYDNGYVYMYSNEFEIK